MTVATAAAMTAMISGVMTVRRRGLAGDERAAGGAGSGLARRGGWGSEQLDALEKGIDNGGDADEAQHVIEGGAAGACRAVARMGKQVHGVDQSGMLPCFLGGRDSCLPMMPRKASARVLRDTAGSMTSVIMPLLAA